MPKHVPQTYANHVRRLPPLYLATALLLAGNLVFTVAVWWTWTRTLTLIPIFVAIALIGTLWYVRVNALVVQNRIIRLEERLRLERLLPEDLRARIGDLSLAQLVALRFASDAELAELTRQALDGPILGKDEIKKRVKSWRADWLRV